ncbi:MAG: iron-sulfur cluster repair di-iron protein [Acidimicrobiia bacterium]|nr:iron-sulfur cluster repair di-iron protein [Acidimicrobiia bacterium]
MSIPTTTTTTASALDADRTLGELVSERSARARVFERHGIDYCCNGHRSLAEAAGAAGVDLAALTTELAAVEATDDPASSLAPDQLMDHIVAVHHAYLYEELPAIEALATKVESVHAGHHPELVTVARLVRAVRADLEPHLAIEEAEIFPAIGAAIDGGSPAPGEQVARLRDDHEAVGALLAELRRVSSDYTVPDDGCASYQALYGRLADLEGDTFRHIHLENNVLFAALTV